MGRSIYADEIGSAENDTWVHKFWFGVQDSDVSEYLDMNEPSYFLADLNVEAEAEIKDKVNELKKAFQKKYGKSYGAYMTAQEDRDITDKAARERQRFASRIDLGEHLLATIQNMKAAGVSEQQLTIEC